MLEITIWGSRGSVPVSGEAFARHGGATTCVEIALRGATGETPSRIIIDCGTGLAELGKGWGERHPSALMLQTHMHWDHIQGFPFFGPLYNPAGRFDFWSVPREGSDFREVLSGQMTRPTFPVGLDIMPSRLSFKDLPGEGSTHLGEAVLVWDEMCHPSGSTGWCVSYRGATVVFSGDVEVQQGSREQLVKLARGADLLIMDAQYTPQEYPKRVGFGHSTPIDAVEVAQEAGVRHLLLTHHDPSHDDDALEEKLSLARGRAAGSDLRVNNARDGLRVSVGSESRPRAGDLASAAM